MPAGYAFDKIIISGIITAVVGGFVTTISITATKSQEQLQELKDRRLPLHLKVLPILAAAIAVTTTIWPLFTTTTSATSININLPHEQHNLAKTAKTEYSATVPEQEVAIPLEPLTTLERKNRHTQGDTDNLQTDYAELDQPSQEAMQSATVTTEQNSFPVKTVTTGKTMSIAPNLEPTEPAKAIIYYQNILIDTADEEIKLRIALLDRLGALFQKTGQFIEAEESLNLIVTLANQLYGTKHGKTSQAMRRLGQFYFENGKLAQAKQKLLAALLIDRELLGNNHPLVNEIEKTVSAIISTQKRLLKEQIEKTKMSRQVQSSGPPITAESVTDLTESGVETNKIVTVSPTINRTVLSNPLEQTIFLNKTVTLANEAIKKGHFKEAEAITRRLLEIRKVMDGEESLAVAAVKHNLASTLANQRKFTEAKQYFKESVDTKKRLQSLTPSLAAGYRNLAAIYRSEKNYAKARTYQGLANNILVVNEGPNSVSLAVGLSDLARFYARDNAHSQATVFFEQSLNILMQNQQQNRLLISTVKSNYSETLNKLGRHAEASNLLEEVKSIQSGGY